MDAALGAGSVFFPPLGGSRPPTPGHGRGLTHKPWIFDDA